jgi:hypothetical protein
LLRVLPVRGLVINGVVTIVVRESLIESSGKSLSSIVFVGSVGSLGLRDSLNHHGNGDVVVVIVILILVSSLLKDGVEGIVTNNLSETLKSNRLDGVSGVLGSNIESDGLNLINGNVN